ncbi:MAG: hypothetical protein HYU81_00385 [Candidatus Brennerbacteria bacterium]|nr:hypothetical protein [Candidatus Brennerbacteria bacterium]
MKWLIKKMGGTLIFSVVAALIVWTTGNLFTSESTPPDHRALVNFFGWQPIKFSVITDAALALFIPLAVVGIAQFVSPPTGIFWDFEFETDDPDYQYGIAWAFGFMIAILSYSIAFLLKTFGLVAPDNSLTTSIAGLVAVAAGLADRQWIHIMLPGIVTGFLATVLMIAGIVNGWIFPWVIFALGFVKYTFRHGMTPQFRKKSKSIVR